MAGGPARRRVRTFNLDPAATAEYAKAAAYYTREDDGLAAQMKDELGDTNVSAICQAALRDELNRQKARAEIDAEGYERVEVYDEKKERDVTFQGRQIGYASYLDQTAYLTPKGIIAVYAADKGDGELYIYPDYERFAADEQPEELLASVAAALGEKYVEELDL
jgi:hypothetical protein